MPGSLSSHPRRPAYLRHFLPPPPPLASVRIHYVARTWSWTKLFGLAFPGSSSQQMCSPEIFQVNCTAALLGALEVLILAGSCSAETHLRLKCPCSECDFDSRAARPETGQQSRKQRGKKFACPAFWPSGWRSGMELSSRPRGSNPRHLPLKLTSSGSGDSYLNPTPYTNPYYRGFNDSHSAPRAELPT